MQNITNDITLKNKHKAAGLEVFKKQTAIKPVVVAALDEYDFEEFIAPYCKDTSWNFDIERMKPGYTEDNLVDALNRNKTGILMTGWHSTSLPANLRTKASVLKYIVHLGGAIKYYIPRELIEQGVIVSNWGNTAAKAVAEHSLLQVLACLRKLARWQIDMHTRKLWRERRPEVFSLFGRRVGIYGFGHCTREFIKLITPFDCRISAYSQSYPSDIPKDVKKAGSLEELFKNNEVVVVLESLTEKTFSSVDERLLRMLPQNAVFVNTARGQIVDEAALAKVAKENKIQIALDVFEKEPLGESSPLRGLGNVLLTPHIAGPTTDSRKLCGLYAMENVNAYITGNPVKSEIGLEQYDRMSIR